MHPANPPETGSRAARAALLSALVFPGVGHCYLGCWWRGVGLALLSLAPLYLLVTTALDITRGVMAELESGAMLPDTLALTRQILLQLQDQSDTLQLASLVFAVLWVVGIVDAHRLGGRYRVGC